MPAILTGDRPETAEGGKRQQMGLDDTRRRIAANEEAPEQDVKRRLAQHMA
jgi:hypothetical protein